MCVTSARKISAYLPLCVRVFVYGFRVDIESNTSHFEIAIERERGRVIERARVVAACVRAVVYVMRQLNDLLKLLCVYQTVARGPKKQIRNNTTHSHSLTHVFLCIFIGCVVVFRRLLNFCFCFHLFFALHLLLFFSLALFRVFNILWCAYAFVWVYNLYRFVCVLFSFF